MSVHSTLASCAQAQIMRYRKFHGCYATWQKLASASLLRAEPCPCCRGVLFIHVPCLCHFGEKHFSFSFALHCEQDPPSNPLLLCCMCVQGSLLGFNLGQCFAIRVHHVVASLLQDSGCANAMPCAGLLWQEPWANYEDLHWRFKMICACVFAPGGFCLVGLAVPVSFGWCCFSGVVIHHLVVEVFRSPSSRTRRFQVF